MGSFELEISRNFAFAMTGEILYKNFRLYNDGRNNAKGGEKLRNPKNINIFR